LPNVGPYIYTTLAFLALLGAPYIYEISSLRVKWLSYTKLDIMFVTQVTQNSTTALGWYTFNKTYVNLRGNYPQI